MKNINIKACLLAIVASVILLNVACKKSFLEVDPRGKLIAKNTDDYNLLLNNASYFINFDYPQIVLGDEIVSVEPYYSNIWSPEAKLLFQYADNIYLSTANPAESAEFLKMLYSYNKIINEVMDSEGGTEQQKLSLHAEALTNRAWIYLYLINYYGQPYNANTADKDLGYFIITESDVTVDHFERSSVQKVYDFIINDLTTAIMHLPESKGSRMRVSKSAAEALLGKTYWFMGKYDLALVQFENAFEHMPKNYTLALFDYKSMLAENGEWGYDSQLSPMQDIVGPDNEPRNQEVLFYKSILSSYSYFDNSFVLSKETLDLFKTPNNSDERLKLYSDLMSGGDPIGTPGVKRKIGFPYIHIGITLPDLFLMRAECRARTGDVNGATEDLETLRKSRMKEDDAMVHITDQVALTKYIIEERIREFALQGYRWFDMRRLSVDPLFSDQKHVHQVLSESGDLVHTFPLRPERLTLRIPDIVMDANPGTVNNP
ncbi:RagB/SusD family nutrient uptake outer membrane protein [Sphingobacterium paucimobilis]|uniref:Uncharacterized protein n=1 Tax=Sphingobacterium paucimobilis HER1398 TaxID=1346330 RepID=U2IZ23_9SPHI|nr:RagB/SusD family nutrient uptake outer membrane protein [Sphingobacterium paucimobilis]ERJ57949.1 hypothetical protein M472_04135 [Sphingobacterium paucimobilis HER1398]